MIFESFPVGPFHCNCVILGCEETQTAIVVDPGDSAERIIDSLASRQLKAVYLLHTHAHLDHIGATATVRGKTGARTVLHEEDMFLCENLSLQAAAFGLPTPPTPLIDQYVKDKEAFYFGRHSVEAIFTPGHTPGSVSFFVEGLGLLTGDTLFAGSIGRTDLWEGSYPTMIQSIKRRLLDFPDDTNVYPGHGPKTTIGREKKSNSFLV